MATVVRASPNCFFICPRGDAAWGRSEGADAATETQWDDGFDENLIVNKSCTKNPSGFPTFRPLSTWELPTFPEPIPPFAQINPRG